MQDDERKDHTESLTDAEIALVRELTQKVAPEKLVQLVDAFVWLETAGKVGKVLVVTLGLIAAGIAAWEAVLMKLRFWAGG